MTSIRDKVRKQIETASTKEGASIEVAFKPRTKMVAKIVAIIKSMKMKEGEWRAISDKVFKDAFGGKKEK